MYKVAYVTGVNNSIQISLKTVVDEINAKGGVIEHIVQSQSPLNNMTIITITIIYKIRNHSTSTTVVY